MHQFEHTALTEVPRLLDEHGVDPVGRLAVLGYAKGLQDWQSGGHEWHVASGRYPEGGGTSAVLGGPTGLGTAGAYIAKSVISTAPQRLRSFSRVPFQPVGQIDRPELEVPFELRLCRHLDLAREHAVEWSREMGMFADAPPVWDEAAVRFNDLPLCAAGLDPDASIEELDLASHWLVWGTYGDDLYPQRYGHVRDVAGAKAQNERLKQVMTDSGEPEIVPVNMMERGLADLWRRTTAPMNAGERESLRDAVTVMIDSWVWELDNQVLNHVPDPVDYVEMRRATFGSDMTMSLARFSHGNAVPPELYETRPVQNLENSAIDCATLLNDVFSYRKEIEFEGEVHNAVLVVQNFLDCDQDRAFEIVHRLFNARMEQFRHVIDVELPALHEEREVSPEAQAALNEHAEELKDWLAGILHWHQQVARYRDSELRHNAPMSGIRSLYAPPVPWNPVFG